MLQLGEVLSWELILITARLGIASRKSKPRLGSARENGRGSGAQTETARRRTNVGVVIKRIGEGVDGLRGSLMNSLTPSSRG